MRTLEWILDRIFSLAVIFMVLALAWFAWSYMSGLDATLDKFEPIRKISGY